MNALSGSYRAVQLPQGYPRQLGDFLRVWIGRMPCPCRCPRSRAIALGARDNFQQLLDGSPKPLILWAVAIHSEEGIDQVSPHA